MREEITGQPYRTVLCQGEVVRGALRESGVALVGLAISDYRFGARDRDTRISLGQARPLPKPGLEYCFTAPRAMNFEAKPFGR